nr:MAG TPA: ParB ddrB-like ParB superfamily domain [Caudoviricetes sp.]
MSSFDQFYGSPRGSVQLPQTPLITFGEDDSPKLMEMPYPGVESVVDSRSWYDGMGTALFSGVGGAAYETGSSVATALSTLPLDSDWKKALGDKAAEWRKTAKNEYAPDPVVSTTAAQVVYGASKELTKIGLAVPAAAGASLVGSPAAGALVLGSIYGINAGIQQSQELQDQGVDAKTANAAGFFTALSGAAGVMMPAAMGWSRLSSAVLGAGANVAVGTNERATLRQVLEKADYSQAAEQFDPTDPLAVSIEALTGGVFGAAAGRVRFGPQEPKSGPTVDAAESAETIDPKVADAARARELIAANRENLPVDTLDPVAVNKGYEAQQIVHDQIQAKKPVRVPADAYNAEKVDAIKRASAERLQKATAEGAVVLQNRDRSTKASIVQMNGIAGNPDYMRLRLSNDFTTGAPVVAYAADIPEAQRGATDVVVAADGRRFPVRYAVVEADDVLTSNNIDGSLNPTYGARDNITAIAGNGRSVGVKEAYVRGTADKYRAELEADKMTGIAPSVFKDMRRPMLVRIMRDEDVTADIGDITNRSATAQLSATEQALTDAQRIDLSKLEFGDDGTLSPESVRQFTAMLPEEERARLVDSNGIPTQDAVKRLDNAIFQQVYKNMGLTDLLNTTEKTGIARMVSAFRQMAPRLLQLEGTGELDFREALSDVLSEIQAARASGAKLSLTELAQQAAIGRKPEVQAFLDFLAKNDTDGGGVRGIVDAFTSLAEYARSNADMAAQGPDMFGQVFKPTKLDIMREFSRTTGVKIREGDFVPVSELKHVDEKARVVNSDNAVKQAIREMAEPPIAPAPKMELITVAREPNGVEHRVWGVNGNPDLTVLPEGIDGVKPLPVRLQESSIKSGHMDDHLPDLRRAGYESIEQAIWDVAQNYNQIFEGKKDGQLVLARPIAMEENGILRRGVLLVEFQEAAGVYRVGTVLSTDHLRYLRNRKLLWDKSPPNRLHPLELQQARTRDLTGPQQPSDENIFGQEIASVNDIKRGIETAAKAQEATVARESISALESAEDSQLKRQAMAALEADPNMRVQLDETKEGTGIAAEYLKNELQKADELSREANQGVPVAVVCALANGGLNDK